MEPNLFISRDLSWLDFNARVLDEAGTPANKLLDRLRFISITAGNLDEFFMVRVAGLRQIRSSNPAWSDPADLTASEQLRRIHAQVLRMLKRQHELFSGILKELKKQGIRLYGFDELSQRQQQQLSARFRSRIMPVLTPLAADPAHPFPCLNSGSIEIAIRFIPAGKEEESFAFVETPELLDRFEPVEEESGEIAGFIPLEELILHNLEPLFKGGTILEKLPFRITRDMDFSIEDEHADDILHYIGRQLQQRSKRDVVRLELPAGAEGKLADWLREQYRSSDEYPVYGLFYLKQLTELIEKAERPELQELPWKPVIPPEFVGCTSLFETIREHENILLFHPYHSFVPVLRLLEEAAADPDVLAIKQTLYRVSGNSPVVRALQKAAEAGKQVTVVLELKARFDETRNIAWAQALDESGAHVVYGIAGLKVHAKALLIVRREEQGEIRRYCHLSTGNYNDRTAASYTDIGMMSCDPELCSDIANMFNVLTGYSAPQNFFRIALAPFTLRTTLEELIEREIEAARSGGVGEIIAKMNSFSDENMVQMLHRAADAGVKITLIVRGICCYAPRPEQENCRIISIVDRFLEHSRIFYFRNQGKEEYYLSSADWMSRNLDRRVELMFPVRQQELTEQLKTVLKYEIADSDKGRTLSAPGIYLHPATLVRYTPARSQRALYCYFRNQAEQQFNGSAGTPLKILRDKQSIYRS